MWINYIPVYSSKKDNVFSRSNISITTADESDILHQIKNGILG